MKTLVVYSSLTGNTKYLAEGIYSYINGEKEILDYRYALNWRDFDRLIIGFWAYRGGPDDAMIKFLKDIEGKKVDLFMTLTAYPDSEHAKRSMQRAIDIIKYKNEFNKYFICHGRLDEKRIQRRYNLPKGHRKYPDEKAIKRWEDAKSHPNEDDIKNAIKVLLK